MAALAQNTERGRWPHLFFARTPQRQSYSRDSGHSLTDDDKTSGYDELRRELSEVLKKQRYQDRLAKALLAPDPARSREVEELTRSIADILVTACSKYDANTYASALADAAILVGAALSSPTQSATNPDQQAP
jgi:hypothetical protein